MKSNYFTKLIVFLVFKFNVMTFCSGEISLNNANRILLCIFVIRWLFNFLDETHYDGFKKFFKFIVGVTMVPFCLYTYPMLYGIVYFFTCSFADYVIFMTLGSKIFPWLIVKLFEEELQSFMNQAQQSTLNPSASEGHQPGQNYQHLELDPPRSNLVNPFNGNRTVSVATETNEDPEVFHRHPGSEVLPPPSHILNPFDAERLSSVMDDTNSIGTPESLGFGDFDHEDIEEDVSAAGSFGDSNLERVNTSNALGLGDLSSAGSSGDSHLKRAVLDILQLRRGNLTTAGPSGFGDGNLEREDSSNGTLESRDFRSERDEDENDDERNVGPVRTRSKSPKRFGRKPPVVFHKPKRRRN